MVIRKSVSLDLLGHNQIYHSALRERDAVRARTLCLSHLVHVRTNMPGY